MNRRKVIQRLTWGLGFSFSTSAVVTSLAGCQNNAIDQWEGKILDAESIATLDALGAFILPRTDTPGAEDLGLTQFTDNMLAEVYDERTQQFFLQGLSLFEQKCQQQFGKPFVDLEVREKSEILTDMEDQSPPVRANIWGNPVGPEYQPNFYRQYKSLLLLGYFTSMEIGKELLDYKPVPGEQTGCRDLLEGEKISVL